MVSMEGQSDIGTRTRKALLTRKLALPDKDLVMVLESNRQIPLAEGDFISYRFHDDIRVHGGTSLELDNSQVVASVPGALVATLLLEGRLDFGYDGLEFSLNAAQGAVGVVANMVRPAAFRRRFTPGTRVCKLNLIVAPAWLRRRITPGCPVADFANRHLACRHLQVSADMLGHVRAILALSHPQTLAEKLRFETLVHGLAGMIFDQVARPAEEATEEAEAGQNRTTDGRIERLVTFIESHLHEELTLARLAADFSMSVSSLQRQFKQNFNLTVGGYIRRRRLEIARQQLERGLVTITEAAYESGYQHPSNFTAAFRRAFGMSPHALCGER
ncbi:hypothetical protein B6S08_16325 [Oceanimonas doudoroffii]|uniref:HTH araC/xylS-type domain-containing protein n=2 Tax=Oceanimonas doudoroffii TaxID=84158 RepID=A0A233RBE0_9GAMM|nr:hypothetical protein B6S08_16325 [Oceanimonas doudoroffii]